MVCERASSMLANLAQVPVDENCVSVDESDAYVSMEFDNRGCPRCSWKIFWVTPLGEQMLYGNVREGSTFEQTTFPGHTWLLKASGDTSSVVHQELRCPARSSSARCCGSCVLSFFACKRNRVDSLPTGGYRYTAAEEPCVAILGDDGDT